MKKFSIFLAVIATLSGTTTYAQPTGKSAAAAKKNATDDFAWGIGLGALAVLGVVVGLAAAAASHDPSTFSH